MDYYGTASPIAPADKGVILYSLHSDESEVPALVERLDNLFSQCIRDRDRFVIGLEAGFPLILGEIEKLQLLAYKEGSVAGSNDIIDSIVKYIEVVNQQFNVLNKGFLNGAITLRNGVEKLEKQVHELQKTDVEEYVVGEIMYQMGYLRYLAQKEEEFDIVIVNELLPTSASLNAVYASSYKLRAEILFYTFDWVEAIHDYSLMMQYRFASITERDKEFFRMLTPFVREGRIPIVIRGRQHLGGEKDFISAFKGVIPHVIGNRSLQDMDPANEIMCVWKTGARPSEPVPHLLLKLFFFDTLVDKVRDDLGLTYFDKEYLVRSILRHPAFSYEYLTGQVLTDIKKQMKQTEDSLFTPDNLFNHIYPLIPAEDQEFFA